LQFALTPNSGQERLAKTDKWNWRGFLEFKQVTRPMKLAPFHVLSGKSIRQKPINSQKLPIPCSFHRELAVDYLVYALYTKIIQFKYFTLDCVEETVFDLSWLHFYHSCVVNDIIPKEYTISTVISSYLQHAILLLFVNIYIYIYSSLLMT
jgi:hypothetical protein